LWSESRDGELVRKAGFDQFGKRYKLSFGKVTLNEKRMGSINARLRSERYSCSGKGHPNIE
jgi:hypothetical protein